MKLRKLAPADAPLMLEWMHDAEWVQYMQADFAAKTLADCEAFVAAAQTDETNLHRAIADDAGQYLGTVSLKHIDPTAKTAEFAITVRRGVPGAAAWGMQAMLCMGFEVLDLQSIYWCVAAANARARRFYQKQGYMPRSTVPDEHGLLWYQVTREEQPCSSQK